MTRRIPVFQLVTFAVIGVAAMAYLALGVIGFSPLSRPYSVTMLMPDGGGIFPRAQVTYRGVPVGSVSSLQLTATGVTVHLSIHGGTKVPADVLAVVAERSPAGEQYVDLRPRTDGPPYLHAGSVIAAGDTRRPLPFSTLLTDLTRFSDSINRNDLSRLADALAQGFSGAGPDLQRLLDNTGAILASLRSVEPQTVDLLDSARTALDTAAAHRGDFRQISTALRQLADRIRASDPDLVRLLTQGPAAAGDVQGLLADNRDALATLLDNLLGVGRILADRLPALRQTLTALPDATGRLAGTVHGDQVWFDLITAGGPACDYPTPRRAPQDATPRPPYLYRYCEERNAQLQQRGSAAAPRPPGDTTAGPPPGANPNAQAPPYR